MDSQPILYVVSGAGLSAESGLATFRSANGIWTQSNIAQVCHYTTWKAHREAVFEFYRAYRADVAAAAPCPAHHLLAHWQATYGPDRVRLLTQNVDDLLERAGAPSVVHLHGNLSELHCTACGLQWAVEFEDYQERTRCPKCQSLKGVKPAVVFFGERAPNYGVLRQMMKALRPQDIVLVVGTSFEVIAPEQMMRPSRQGATGNWLVDIDPACQEWFSTVIADTASRGIARLESAVAAALKPA